MIKDNKIALMYSFVTLILTFIVGQVLLILYPNGNTIGSSNYLIFYLMILGNTFMFGTIKEKSKGVLPCVIAHMIIDSLAVLMLVQSNIVSISILVTIEIVFSAFANKKIPNA